MPVVVDAFHATDLPTGGVAAIGNFDGVHRGHQALLERVTARTRGTSRPALVVTFEPHPLSVLRPERALQRLTSRDQKARLLEAAGIEFVLMVSFTREFSQTPARRFVEEFLHGRLGLEEIYVGAGFVFGHERDGNLELLQSLGAELGFSAHGVEKVAQGGERISSTRLRAAIAEGRVADAREMLGRAYEVTGQVVRGDRMGQRLGWPTANLAPESEILPADGVYATRIHLPSYPATFDSVTNIGTRPTVYENYQRVLESHILGFDNDVYGESVEVQFFQRLREERIFPTIMDLSAQIGRDVETTREFFAALRRLEGEQEGGAG
ncbi:MAG: bifunctional riboflavin kinase/FAD synthetase [Acidobacteriota bacterium]